ncbi:MAG TPA: phospholipase D-like domain-containing protein [Turneriella sp.]|nr:phospholipase D-like domain-containing protein [Turneriella sp.]
MLRSSDRNSPFRRSLHHLINLANTDELVLCSGYFWEPGNSGYSLLSDELYNQLSVARSNNLLSQGLTLIGGMFKPEGSVDWLDHFKNFGNKIQNAGIRVSAFEMNQKNWHAKVAIRLAKGVPVAAIVGSSNLTGPAYREQFYRWNYEADIYIWIKSINASVENLPNANPKWPDILAEMNHKNIWNEEEHLKRIYKEIIENKGLHKVDISKPRK